MCKVFGSYGLPLSVYETPGFHAWIARHWTYVVRSDKTLQAYDSLSCGHYVFLYLQERVRGRTLLEIMESFLDADYVWNDHRVGERVRVWIQQRLQNPLDEPDGIESQHCVSRCCMFS